ncbi:hypothetical protein BJV82DRAFT_670353 [Fennellomyces sp. T-0311]|nr:hypothetical protein BJV82DRAFT_670353 [Fennellomyces sp. T-0311]
MEFWKQLEILVFLLYASIGPCHVHKYCKNFRQNQNLVGQINVLASKKGVSLSQFVLVWILAQGPEFIVIPDTKRLAYLEQNINAGQITLAKDEVAEMKALLDTSKFMGARSYEEEVSLLDETSK